MAAMSAGDGARGVARRDLRIGALGVVGAGRRGGVSRCAGSAGSVGIEAGIKTRNGHGSKAAMPVHFSLPALAKSKSTDGAADPGRYTEEDLRDLGIEMSSNQFSNEYMFSRMGGWNVTVRASVIRIVFFKLLGTGLAAAFLASSSHVGEFASWSLALSAAVNFVAAGHYYYIWQVRNQVYRGPKYDKWMARVGRAPEEDTALFAAEETHDKKAIFFQEVLVDGLRHSDWLCTLVLMTLDLGHQRTFLNYATSGTIPNMPIAKEWVGSCQAIMIGFASIWRFYTNEARYVLRDGKDVPPSVATMVLGWGSLVVSCGLFAFICWSLLDGLPDTHPSFASHINADIVCLKLLVLVWAGYPIMAVTPRLAQWNTPGSEYSATWSLLKDLGFAALDVTSKAGLAVFFILKTGWLSGDAEDALVASGKTALGIAT
jgi:hypothetical protein